MNANPRLAASNLKWNIGYATFALVLSVFGTLRLRWAWPDVPSQSELWFIDDIDQLLSGSLGNVVWFDIGGTHALNGYRWFEYLNAYLFGFNSQVEIYGYFAVTLAISLMVGTRMLRSIDDSGRVGPRLLVFAVPIVLSSLVGAGSRGMELGTYVGVAIVVALFLLIDSDMGLRRFSVVSGIGCVALVFVFLGGYVAGPVAALIAVRAIQRWVPTAGTLAISRLSRLLIAFLTCAVAYSLLLALKTGVGSALTGAGAKPVGGPGNLRTQMGLDAFFPLQYILSGQAGGLISNTSLERFEAFRQVLRLGVGTGVIGLACLAVYGAYRTVWNKATVPLLLICYPVGIELMLLVSRNTTVDFAQSTWYSLHFKVQLLGIIWLGVLMLSALPERSWKISLQGTSTRVAAAVGLTLSVVLVALLVAANVVQFERQPYEREYFQRIALATADPSLITTDANGLTPLLVDRASTERAIAIMRRHRLGVFRSAAGRPHEAGGESRPPFVFSGDHYPDGWVGPSFLLTLNRLKCRRFTLTLDPSAAWGSNTVRVRPNFGRLIVRKLDKSAVAIRLRPVGARPSVAVRFDSSWVPAELGLNGDMRDLSARAAVSCAA